ncbi:MAG: galactokinase [Flavobacteriaceae bacterium]|nr:galactokinase [Flavobacteriaceae bacterium]
MTTKKLLEKVTSSFEEKYKSTPVLTFSPGRINLIGEHTDYNDGFVFPAAIDKGIVSGIQKNDRSTCSVYALDAKTTYEFDKNDLKPLENGTWRNYVLGVVFEVVKKQKLNANFDIVFAGNIPSGSGLSSSAALENSIVFGLNELFDLKMTKEEMIFISQKAEHDFVQVKCGIMDQYASMFGQENSAILLDCRSLESTIFPVDFKNHEILLINSNVTHSLAESAYNERRNVCEKIAALLHVTALRDVSKENLKSIENQLTHEDYLKGLNVLEENERVLEASVALKENDLKRFGKLLFDSHNGLQHQYKVSCTELDFLVDLARQDTTVLGARMMGGGFGGCTINLVSKEHISEFKANVEQLYEKQFSKKCSFYQVKLSNGTHRVCPS